MRKNILFLGASITQGKISMSYVKMLKNRLGIRRYKFINHGVAGYESYNVLSKLDKAIKINPDFVVLLVGTNDVLSSLDPKLAEVTRKMKHIPHKPILQYYSNNIIHIVQRLRQETNSKIAVASLPVIGENLDSSENRTIDEYNSELKRIAENENCTYLPVNEKQKDYLITKAGGKGKDSTNSTKLAFKALFAHYLLFTSLDRISAKNGFLLLTDGIHQNSIGAKFIADEAERFIRGGKN